MWKKLIIILSILISFQSCKKEDGKWNLKRSNHLDCFSENFQNNSFLIENATIINPNNNTPDPSGWHPTCGSIDLKCKINKINDGLKYYVGICWDGSINPVIDNNATYIGSDRKALDGAQYIDNNEIYFQMNCKFIGGGKKFSKRESAFGSSGSYNSYLLTNTIYYLRYFIYIETPASKKKDIQSSIIVKYSDNFKITIP